MTSPDTLDLPPGIRPDDVPRPVPGEPGLAGSDRPDITRFLNVRRTWDPSLSPAGDSLAFRSDITGRPQLWVVSADGGWPRQLTFGESVTSARWSPAGDWILYATDRAGNEREGYYLVSPDGTRERELLAPSDAFRVFGGFSPDGDRIAYATTARNGIDFDIHVLDVRTGEDRRVFEGRMGLYPVAWKPDGSALLLTEARGEDANDVYALDLREGRLETVFRPEERSAYGSFAWRPDGGGFYLTTNQDRPFRGLAFYDLATGRLEYLETPDGDVEEVTISPGGRYLVWTVNEEGRSRLHARDRESGETLETPDLPPGVYSVRRAEGAATLAISVTGPRVPGDIWSWDPGAGETARSTRSSLAGLDPAAFRAPEHVSFPARDGVTLHGLLYLPRGDGAAKERSPGAPPVVLQVHGGPTAQARPSFQFEVQYLLSRGIAVFDLNFRGSTGYGKEFARLDDGRLRPDAVRDMEEAVRWLEADGRVDASRAAVMGGSYGGYMTLAALTFLPERFEAGISFVGVSNWITALEGASPQLKASDRIEYGDIEDPDDRAFFRDISPLFAAENVRAPVMVLQGANDPRVPVGEADQFVREIRERGGEVTYLRFPDEGHGIRKLSNRIIAYRRVARFLEERLAPGTSVGRGR